MNQVSAHEPSRRRALVALALPVGSALAGCAIGPAGGFAAAPPAPAPSHPVPAPTVRIGDRWRYAEINRYNGSRTGVLTARVERVRPALRVSLTYADGRARDDEVYAHAWQVLVEPAYDQLQTFDAPMPLLPTPITAGAGVDTRARYQVPAASATFHWSQMLRAPTWERVRVPAGEFDCLRVERLIVFQHSDIFRLTPDRVDTLWYAPAVNRWARREWTGTYRISGRRPTTVREDWVAWELLDYLSAPIS